MFRHLIQQVQYIQLLKSMKSRERTREKYEQYQHLSLLKRIHFYEHLIGYNCPEKQFFPGHQIKTKTATHFFPTLHPFTHDQYGLLIDSSNKQTIANGSSSSQPQISVLGSREPKVVRSAKLQSFRITKRENRNNINELNTKTITPSARINKKPISLSKESIVARTKKERWAIQVGNDEQPRDPSPLKRNYMGDVHYIKEQKRQSGGRSRKQSICGWEIDNELIY